MNQLITTPFDRSLISGSLYEAEYSVRTSDNYSSDLLELVSRRSCSTSAIDIGCGIGLGINSLSKFYQHIYACDISKNYLDYGLHRGYLNKKNSFLLDFSSKISVDQLKCNLTVPCDLYSLFCTINYLTSKASVIRFICNAQMVSLGGLCIFQYWNSDLISPKAPHFITYSLESSFNNVGHECEILVNRYTVWTENLASEFKTYLIHSLDDGNILPIGDLNKYQLWDNDFIEKTLNSIFSSVDYIVPHKGINKSYKIAICQ